MRLLYRATSLIDAQLVVDLVRSAGIDACMLNQNAQSAAGEIPPDVAGPQVWVVDDGRETEARELVALARSAATGEDRICRHCGEPNPSNFLSCWACGACV